MNLRKKYSILTLIIVAICSYLTLSAATVNADMYVPPCLPGQTDGFCRDTASQPQVSLTTYKFALLFSTGLFLTIVIEGITLLAFKFKQKKLLLTYAGINVITVLAFYALLMLAKGSESIAQVILYEVVIIIAEVVAMTYIFEESNKKKLIIAISIANILSSLAGLLINSIII